MKHCVIVLSSFAAVGPSLQHHERAARTQAQNRSMSWIEVAR